ncbi:MAG TPA: hypothetical protein VGL34_12075 [Steroidobacteraceae bacterium]|jgi:hypothetical protein
MVDRLLKAYTERLARSKRSRGSGLLPAGSVAQPPSSNTAANAATAVNLSIRKVKRG